LTRRCAKFLLWPFERSRLLIRERLTSQPTPGAIAAGLWIATADAEISEQIGENGSLAPEGFIALPNVLEQALHRARSTAFEPFLGVWIQLRRDRTSREQVDQ